MLCAFVASAQNYVTITAWFTNAPATGDTFVRNGATATWTNGPINSTSFIQTNGPNGSATNLWRFLGANNSAFYTRMGSSTSVVVSASGLTIAVTGSGVGLTTNTAVPTNNVVVTVPLHNHAETNRTNIANWLVTGIDTNASVAFRETATALSNHLSLGQVQVSSNKTFTHSLVSQSTNSQTVTTNSPRGNFTNLWAQSARVFNFTGNGTNGGATYNPTNYNGQIDGAHIQSIKVVFDNGFYATNQSGIFFYAATNGAILSKIVADTTGYPSLTDTNATAIDFSADPEDRYILNFKSARGIFPNKTTYGSTFSNYWTTTNVFATAFQVFQQGITATGSVLSASTSYGLTTSNNVFRGTNVINGRIDFTSRANTSLADGNNSGVVLGTNVYVRLSGHSAACTNAGFVAEQDGSFHILEFDNPVNNLTILNNSGLDAAAANRITTGTGGDLNFTNNPVIIQVIYNATAARWRLVNGMPYR